MVLSQKQLQIEQRTLDEAEWYLEHKSTVREVATNFKVSKSTVYRDLTYHLKSIDHELHKEVALLLHYNRVHCMEKMTEASVIKRKMAKKNKN